VQKVISILERLQKTRNWTSTNSAGPEPAFDCPRCRDRGVVIGQDGMARICSCQEQRRLQRLFQSSQITPAFRYKTFENFQTDGRPASVRAMYECARDYADRFHELRDQENNWLVLLGEPGSGKTHLSMAVANRLLAQGVPVLYFQHVEGMNELREALRADDQEERSKARMDSMKQAGLLLWDDLFKGREEPTPWVLEVVFEVLNFRYLNLLPTVISSERAPKDLLDIDRAIGSRIIERGKGHMVLVQGREANYRVRG